MLRLLVTYGREEYIFAVPVGEAKLGSAPENDIVLRIPGISRRHVAVRKRSGGVEVTDLGSKNGLLVEGERVKRTMLTPGLRIQLGAAWLEIEEVSTSEEALARLDENPSGETVRPSLITATAEPKETPRSPSPEDAAHSLAYHIAQVGVGLPEKRADLLLRIKVALEAEAFATLETTRYGRLRIWESIGGFSPSETRSLSSLVGNARITVREQPILKRSGKTLLAGHDSWFLVARFTEETLAREMWRKEFLRFLASQFFMPVRSLDEIDAAEADRVLGLTRGNKLRTAKLLGICRNTLDSLLRRGGPSKP